MALWTRANSLWLVATCLVSVAYVVPQPFKFVLFVLATCTVAIAIHQQFKYALPKQGEETLIDRMMGGVLVFFIVMVFVIFTSILLTLYLGDLINPFIIFKDPASYVAIMLCLSGIGFLLQFFYGSTGKDSTAGFSKPFIITVSVFLSMILLFSIRVFFPGS